MTEQHPITPPPELVQEWIAQPACQDYFSTAEEVAIAAARWGADMELEACCEWLRVPCPSYGRELRNERRPKPPSLAEEALDAMNLMLMFLPPGDQREQGETIRRALERLQELENNG